MYRMGSLMFLVTEYMYMVPMIIITGMSSVWEIMSVGLPRWTIRAVGYREQLLIVEADVVLLIERVDSLHCIEQTLHGGIAGVGCDAVVEVLQEV